MRDRLPSAAQFGLLVATPTSLGRRGLAAIARRNAINHARRFIAGTDSREVLAAALRERRLKRAFTIDVLGEAVTSEAEADLWQRHYLNLIEQLGPTVNAWPEIPQIDQDRGHPLPRVNVSIKLSALDSQFDPIDPEGSTAARCAAASADSADGGASTMPMCMLIWRHIGSRTSL